MEQVVDGTGADLPELLDWGGLSQQTRRSSDSENIKRTVNVSRSSRAVKIGETTIS